MSIKLSGVLLLFLIVMSAASCASTNCDYNTGIRPDPISVSAEQGTFYGTNYSACYIIDGIVFKEPISECAYKYFREKRRIR